MSADDTIDQLVRRLRDASSSLSGQQPPVAPPIGDWRRSLSDLRDRQEQAFVLLDAGAPRLAELLSHDRDDRAFVEGLYRHLLGREVDSEGLEHYAKRVATEGRLAVAVELADADEALRHRRLTGQVLPARLEACRNWRGRLDRLGPLRDIGLRLWRRWLADMTRRYRPRWALEAATCRLLVQQSDWCEERHQLATALLEMDDRQRHFGARQDHEYARQQALWEQLAAWRRAITGLGGTVAESGGRPGEPVGDSRSQGDSREYDDLASELDAYYLAFETAFRGPEASLSAHLDHYRADWSLARQAGETALDLGCGRGEWLHLLRRAGFEARGIDLNATMVAHCREQGFEVEHQDALAALSSCETASVALISGFHIAEHLPFEVLFRLVGEAHRVLAPGGVLILETPNPENLIVASYSFYHDLTHRNPLPPPTLEFLCQFHGFGDTTLRRFNPPPETSRVPGQGPVVERLNAMLASAMDYAVVARKASSLDQGNP
ncbi:methyltransferase domain-containing protein [Halomonas organivorans]|uniref:O-antigen chain-terminating methyltransferase n=1 Tax=Halomonas organivorans TaxID=257772 RepID=A0A7W5C332_9GAMM|nr:methyltransferase domain-containing protein [Halomonas organivorans]MBB3142873.1 O-antigen chain-terminating methyltransferase [Halomonas organivorans]